MVISITRVAPNTKWIVSRPLARRLSYPPTFLFVDNQKYAINEWSRLISFSLDVSHSSPVNPNAY